ncbi:MAG: bifunctional 3-(3-hydroxy-phenyl)propionate/3-hydroxycinnamic acid hydroxylase [Pigmentiphaga sp.]|uniref:bifunctional 3-(3-hydroxy-phenyl)propionate/3-hydroxycinnamic acid hydroxylase MhpA n=1 Tax=Pigmentiphaga sp. TaxID=1977564 RepID=UPI0029BDDA10|nr:bifunctional 3-(3-hydroxy-phenyl)propionate/3-hydroxycinnamic acid hydroxylase [Pigmentiphaga sp.]MDX3905778.1 bifunctional 3-(3-hydroxy-phenyl)propionate/3-hydroxycinnamic acid hydroxylase [Pigmentiphaga sp.]
MAETSTATVDVAIVGYGPVGALLANLLGQLGLSVLVLDKEPGIYPLPRAIHFDGEVMRVFQSAGLRQAVLEVVRPGTQGMHFVNAEGRTLLIRGGTAELGPHGCANNYYFHQPELEQVLRQGAGRFPHVEIRLGCEVTALREEPEWVELELTDSVRADRRVARARYVVGCDGARSLVRKTMGSRMEDLGLHQPWLVFDVILDDASPALPGHTIQYCDPARPMTYCNVVGRRRRWEIMIMPDDDVAAIVQPDTLWKLVGRWIRPEQAALERAVVYTFHSVLAHGWRKGRMLLAGDSAHQTPPFLGQGMCAGMRDAANLAWKLEAVLRGRAAAELLDSYEAERAPHVRAFVELAVRLGDIIQTTDPERARERDRRFEAGGPEIFEFPSPALGAGLQYSDRPPVGQPFPQPRMDDGRLMDDVLGYRMAVIGHAGVIRDVGEWTRERWERLGAVVLDRPDRTLADWLDAHGVGAVVLRPDRYLMGMARTPDELERITARLPTAAAALC